MATFSASNISLESSGEVPVEKLIMRVATIMGIATMKEIREILLGEGCSEEQAFLVYSAAKVFCRQF